MSAQFQAPKGTFDILPSDAAARDRVEEAARDLFERTGYERIDTPILEDTELFARSVGEATDIVQKEMFTFEDLGGRRVSLRPEGTASVCRAYLDHGMQKLPQPVKLWYLGPFFRYEAPQAGRFRQFHQIGAEAIGSGSPLVDAELIILLDRLLRDLGVADLTLKLGSLGTPQSRAGYREELKGYLRENESSLSREVRERIDANPLRAFDAKDEGTRAVMEGAPTMLDRLEGEDAEHFGAVRALLERAGVDYDLDATLVRGLDYYTRTVFAFESSRLGAQSEVGGGGRYDALIEELGGPPTPAAGWAAGIERILLASESPEEPRRSDVFVAAAPDRRDAAFALVTEMRAAGLSADLDLAERGMKGQMRQADRLGARRALILDEGGGAQLRDMDSGEQRPVELGRIVEELTHG